ncbi:MAG TPA: tetratricopeptide repeat protein, partial [Anaerolineae bacterium]|nr:tetratricopeptide repeat protein [Anaerolineae bacterium]
GLTALSLRAHTQIQKHNLEDPEETRALIEMLRDDIEGMAASQNVSVRQAEQGLRYMEEAQIALHAKEYQTSINLNRKSIDLLKDWPPPHNNLAMALFYNGRPEEAIAEARLTLQKHPQNIQALSGIIRYLAWSGNRDEAEEYWPPLKDLQPSGDISLHKKAEAAAILDKDEAVYQTLHPFVGSYLNISKNAPDILLQAHFFTAIAEANTGRQKEAKQRLKRLKRHFPWTKKLLSALYNGKPGPGNSNRYPYFHSSEMLPRARLEEFADIVRREDRLSETQFKQKVQAFAQRFPQIILVAEKFIWEEDMVDGGIMTLSLIGTPAAYQALYRFATSQAGDDDLRMNALMELSKSGLYGKEPVRIWRNGEWMEILPRAYEINPEKDLSSYPQSEWDKLERATKLYQSGDDEKAIPLFEELIAQNPTMKEAYNNLASLYAQLGNRSKAVELLDKALELDPLYVFPRVNLANYLLDDGDIQGAEDMLAPLADITRFHPLEMAAYLYSQAKIHVAKGEIDQARAALQAILDVDPDYQPAYDLLEYLDERGDTLKMLAQARKGFESYAEKQHKRNLAKRARTQKKLTTSTPSLAEILPLYTKEDQLTAMARTVMMYSGWSTLRKAELIDALIENLQDKYALTFVVEQLSDEEIEALKQVLDNGGAWEWEAFSARYDNDLK